MEYLIDSNILIDVLNADPSAVAMFSEITKNPCSISVVSYMEVLEGIFRFPENPMTEDLFSDLLQDFDILPVTQSIARRCAIVRADLHSKGRRVRQRALDLLIAATAIEHNLTLVTRNQDDYSDIPGIVLFNDF